MDGITDSMEIGLSKLWELVMDMSLGELQEFGDGQGGVVCCNSWGHKESDTTERLK